MKHFLHETKLVEGSDQQPRDCKHLKTHVNGMIIDTAHPCKGTEVMCELVQPRDGKHVKQKGKKKNRSCETPREVFENTPTHVRKTHMALVSEKAEHYNTCCFRSFLYMAQPRKIIENTGELLYARERSPSLDNVHHVVAST